MTDVYMRILTSIVGSNLVLGAMKSMGGAMAGLGFAAVGATAASVKAAADYQSSLLKVQALAGVSAKDADAASQAILNMAPKVGKSPQDLAEGLYYIAGAGYSAKDSLLILEDSAKAAATGMTSTQTVANAMTASMKAFNIPASQSHHVVDMMTKAVSTGKVEWADYAKVIGKVSLNASQAGVSFQESNAAFSVLTNVMPSADQAADSLNSLLQSSSRFAILTERAKSLGLTFDANKYKSMNFIQRLEYLKKITHGNSEEVTKLLGEQNASAAMTALLTNHAKDYSSALDGINHASDGAGAAQIAFATTQKGLNASLDRLNAAIEVLEIRFGMLLLPVLTLVVNAIVPLVAGLSDLIAGTSDLNVGIGWLAQRFFNLWRLMSTPLTSAFFRTQQQSEALSVSFARQAVPATVTLTERFRQLGDSLLGIVLPRLQSTADWMISTGTPLYIRFGVTIKSHLTDMFHQASQAAMDFQKQAQLAFQAQSPTAIKTPKFGAGLPGLPDFSGLFQLIKPVGDFIQEHLNPGLQQLSQILGPILGPPIKAFQQAMIDLQPAFVGFEAFWQYTIMPMFSMLTKPSTTGSLSQLQKIWNDLWDTIEKLVVPGVEYLLDMIEMILPWILRWIGFLIWLATTLLGPVLDGIDWVIRQLGNLGSWIHKNAIPALDTLVSVVSEIPFALQDAFSWLGPFLAGVWDSMKFGASVAVNFIIDILNDLIDQFNLVSGAFHIAAIPHIQHIIGGIASGANGMGSGGKRSGGMGHLASGGSNIAAGYYLMGEYGPEVAYMPGGSNVYSNSRSRNMLIPASGSRSSGGSTTVINLSVSTMARSRAEVARLVDMIEQELGSRFRTQTSGYSSGGIF